MSFIFNYILSRVELFQFVNRKGNVVELAWVLRAKPPGQSPIVLLYD